MHESTAIRIERVLEGTLDRHAGRSEAERLDALTETLRAELTALAAAERGPVLGALRALHPPEPPSVGSSGPTARERELEEEVERLRAELAARPTASAAPAAAPATGDLGRRIAAALLGPGRDVDRLLAEGAAAEERIVSTVAALVEFAGRLGRVYLGATADADRTMAGRVQAFLADALEGRASTTGLRVLFDEMFQRIGSQLLAFREASEAGARNFLKQLAPAAIEAASAKGGVQVGGRRPFFYRECWELFVQRFEELRTADHLYESYFDGAFRAALLRQGQGGAERKGAR
jgi:hypothetical protein